MGLIKKFYFIVSLKFYFWLSRQFTVFIPAGIKVPRLPLFKRVFLRLFILAYIRSLLICTSYWFSSFQDIRVGPISGLFSPDCFNRRFRTNLRFLISHINFFYGDIWWIWIITFKLSHRLKNAQRLKPDFWQSNTSSLTHQKVRSRRSKSSNRRRW